jgi:hypothetical protein
MTLEPYDNYSDRWYNRPEPLDENDPDKWFFREHPEYGDDTYLAYPERVYFDEYHQVFRCRCQRYQTEGKCSHLWRWQPEVTIRFSDEWKDCL